MSSSDSSPSSPPSLPSGYPRATPTASSCEPGTILTYDFRPNPHLTHRSHEYITCVTFNIERGYQLEKILAELRSIDADIIALQEVDIGCERSGWYDIGYIIAKELQMNYVFVSEFLELHSPLRPPLSQGGGCHGNAILTRFAMDDIRILSHTSNPINWEVEGVKLKEPRRGARYTLVATVHIPPFLNPTSSSSSSSSSSPHACTPVLIYTCHLEVFCGLSARIYDLTDVFIHARQRTDVPRQILLGDLNTMAHSIARLSHKYARDSFRWRSLGWTEAEWMAYHLLDVMEHQHHINHRLLKHGFPKDFCVAARNPGFYDPFDVYHDVTLWNYHGLFQGKLDWILLKSVRSVARWLSNHDYSASDHKLMAIRVDLCETSSSSSSTSTSSTSSVPRPRLRRRSPGILTCTQDERIYWACAMGIVAFILYFFQFSS